MRYHITYTDRRTGGTETGRVYIPGKPTRSAAQLRAAAIQAAYFKYPYAKRSSISAVRVPNALPPSGF